MIHVIQEIGQVIDRADAEMRHAPVSNPSVGSHLEPIDSAVSEKKAVHICGLRDDDEIGLVLADPSQLRHMGDAGKPSTLLVHAAALFHGPLQTNPAPANGFDGEDRCGNTRLLVRSAASIKPSIFYLRS